MLMKKHLLLIAFCGTFTVAWAQNEETGQSAWFTESQYFSSSVNNEGEAIIFKDQMQPYEIWNPRTGERNEIGGTAAGNGVGGLGTFSDDGSLVSAVRYSDAINVSTAWEKSVFEDAAYNYHEFSRSIPTSTTIYAIGSSSDGQKGFVMQSANNGKTWKKPSIAINHTGESTVTDEWHGGLECIAWMNWAQSFIGGHNGVFYYGKTGGGSYEQIDPHPADNTDEVATYWAMDFMDTEVDYNKIYGAIGLELADGTGAVWYTTDAMESTKEATGVAGVPAYITHVGETYFMVTRNGHIQKSEDHGATWKDVFVLNAGPSPWSEGDAPMFSRIRFADAQYGMALSIGAVYVTTDGGETWVKKTVAGSEASIVWHDVAFFDGKATIVGSLCSVFETKDMGETWTRLTPEDGGTTDMMAVLTTDKGINICGAGGTFLHRDYADTASGYTAAIYNVESGEWQDLPSSGYFSGEATSSAYGMSGDGSTVVGGVYVYNPELGNTSVHCDAAAWVNGELVDLGTKYPENNSNTMAYKASYDGSVIVGWQDHRLPRYGTVWRKNASGGYDRSLMFKDNGMTEDDLDLSYETGLENMMTNVLGCCNAVSSDGKWIGGRSNTAQNAVDGAWLWSEETGLKLLNPEPGADDMVYDMTNDASFVVGQVGPGGSSWVWTEKTGMKNINNYLTEDLGINLGEYYICGVMDISPNGRYITGWCMKGMGKYAYVVDLKGNTTSIEKPIEQVKASVYPNPVATDLHIDLPFDNIETRIRLYSLQGSCVRQMKASGKSNVMNVSNIAPGLYILNVSAKGVNKSFKIEIKH